MATIRELATLAGVSTCTVSLALRDHPRISPATRQRIKELATMYHYQTNRLAHGAITGKSATIGVIVPTVSSYYYSRILQGIIDTALSYSYHITILQSPDVLHTCRAIQTLVEQRVEGILIATTHFDPVPNDVLLMARSNGIATIGVGQVVTPTSYDFVTTNEMQVATTIIDYLHNLGHREIAYVSPLARGHRLDRSAAIMATLQRYHLSTSHFIDTWDLSAEQAFERILHDHKSVTAIIGMEDTVSAEMMQVASRHGMQIPRDMSIIGCGNLHLTNFLKPPLTTIEQYPSRIGEEALNLLMQRLLQPQDGVSLQEIIRFPVELVVRESCGPPPKRSRVS